MALFAFSIRAVAISLGGLGLFLVTLADSSFVSLPELADLLLVYMVVQHRDRALFYAGMCTLGSLAGCYLLYFVTRYAGDNFLRRRFSERHIERGLASFQKYGLLAIIIPAVLPPPAPFKIFVLLAGLADVSVRDFGLAVVLGRGARYFALAFLALWIGQAAIDFLRQHNLAISAGMGAVIVAGIIVYFIRRRRHRPGA